MKIVKHKKIIDYLNNIPENRVFLDLPNRQYSFGEIRSICAEFKQDHSEVFDKNCAVISTDRESLAIYLPAIDSISLNVFLQPNDIGTDREVFYQAANIEFLISLGNEKIISVKRVSLNKEQEQEQKKRSSECYLIATSGTTGTPKLASYSLESLTATAKKDIDKGEDFIWGLCYDINRFAGLQVYLQAISSGSTLVISPESESVKFLVNLYSDKFVNCISATPSFLRKILMVPTHGDIPLKRITLGGEISNQSILNALVKTYKKANVIHIYASTEVGVGFSVKDQKEGFPTNYISNNEKIGCELKIVNDLLWIKSDHGCSRFVKGNLDIDLDSFIDTGDLVRVSGDRVHFIGRDSGSINVGGNKVMPEKVEGVLESSAHVLMAKVFAKKNSILGELVSAELVLSDFGSHFTFREIRTEVVSFCREKLESFEIPVLIKIVKEIETNAMGKKNRTVK